MGMNHQKIDIGTAYDAALLGRIAKVQGNARTVHNLVYSAVCVLLVVLCIIWFTLPYVCCW